MQFILLTSHLLLLDAVHSAHCSPTSTGCSSFWSLVTYFYWMQFILLTDFYWVQFILICSPTSTGCSSPELRTFWPEAIAFRLGLKFWYDLREACKGISNIKKWSLMYGKWIGMVQVFMLHKSAWFCGKRYGIPKFNVIVVGLTFKIHVQ